MVIIYEDLTKKSLRKHLYEISNFLNFKVDQNRIECAIKYSEGKVHRKEKCISTKAPTYLYTQDGNITKDIFTKEQRREINISIDRVSRALVKRGFNPLPLSDYKDTKIDLKICT